MTDDTDKPGGEEQTDDEGWGEAAVDAGWGEAEAKPAAKAAAGPDPKAPSASPSSSSPSPSLEPEPEPDLAPAPAAPWDSSTPEIYATADPEPYPPKKRYEDLTSAVGVDTDKEDKKRRRKKKRKDDDDDDDGGGKRRRVSTRTTVIAIIIGVLALAIATIVVLGNFNSRYYYFVCGAETITAERGKTFPPWGSEVISGKQWEPIKIPPNAECEEARYESSEELEEAYSKALFAQAEARLLAGGTENVTVAAAQLDQALLLLRDPNRKKRRDDILRLQGDVEYARARAQAAEAANQLAEAAQGFDKATKKVPRHTRDASKWAEFARKVQKMIELGPKSLEGIHLPSGENPNPSTSNGGSTSADIRDAGPGPVDAEPGVALPPTADAKPAPIDAGLPSGGVLL